MAEIKGVISPGKFEYPQPSAIYRKGVIEYCVEQQIREYFKNPRNRSIGANLSTLKSRKEKLPGLR